MKFKEPKTIDEQIEYLKQDKRIVFNDISINEAKNVLTKYGYINVISPFKYFFAEKDKNGNVIKTDGRHVYNRNVDFFEYYSNYLKERSSYAIIYKNICEFENIFNSIVSYECIHYYNIDDSDKFEHFINSLKLNIPQLGLKESVKTHYLAALSSIYNKIDEYQSIYILLDRLTLNEIFIIFRCCNSDLKSRIFKKLISQNCTFKETRITNFENKFTKIVLIRNYVFHNNSLTILIRYYKVGTKELRKTSERKEFSRLVKMLSRD